MGSAKKAVKKVTHVAEKVVKKVTNPIEEGQKSLRKEVARGGKELVGSVAGALTPEIPAEDTSAQDDLMRRQGEERLSQESELAKRKALRKKGGKGRGSLLSGSALGVADSTLG